MVHGHTIVERVEHRPNRIAIDTGVAKGGPLSCLVLEGDKVALLEAGGKLKRLPVGAGLARAAPRCALAGPVSRVFSVNIRYLADISG